MCGDGTGGAGGGWYEGEKAKEEAEAEVIRSVAGGYGSTLLSRCCRTGSRGGSPSRAPAALAVALAVAVAAPGPGGEEHGVGEAEEEVGEKARAGGAWCCWCWCWCR